MRASEPTAGWAPQAAASRGPKASIVKASTVTVRREDPNFRSVEDRLAEAAEEAYRRGYEEGFQTGALEAGTHLADAADRLVTTMAAALADAQSQLQVARAADAQRLAALALTVAEWAVRRELSSVPEAFFGRLAELLADRDRRTEGSVAVAPELVEATRTWLADDEVRVSGDGELAVGEARLSLGDATLFATFADAFARAQEAINGLADPFEGLEVDDEADDEEVEVLYDATTDGAW
jgi:flagellar biosynthesis/type III secretory pathway protein FliH